MSVELDEVPDRDAINQRALATDHLMADLGQRTRRGGAIAIGAQVTRLAIQFATLAILARLLLPDDFGVIAMAAAITAFVAMFSELGLAAATVQRTEIDQDTVSGLFLINLGMGLAVMLAVIALAPLAAWFFDDPRVLNVIIAMALPVPLLAASRQHAALLQRGMRWAALEVTTIVAQAVAALVAIGIAWQTDLGYWALVAQSWTAGLLTFGLLWLACPWRPSRVRDWSQVRSALAFGLHLTGFQFLNYFHRQFDDLLVGHRWGSIELGFYNRAYMLLLLPTHVINGPIGSAVIPALSRMQDDPARWRRTYLDALGLITIIGVGISAVFTATAEPLVAFIFGPGWEKSGEIFALLSLSLFVAAPMNSAGWIYVSLGETRRMMHWALLTTPVWIGAFLLGLPYGAKGVAATYSVAVWCLALPCFAYAAAKAPLRLREMTAVLVPLIASGIVASAAIWWTMSDWIASHGALGLIAGGAACCAIYGGLVALLVASLDRYSSLKHRVLALITPFTSRLRRSRTL